MKTFSLPDPIRRILSILSAHSFKVLLGALFLAVSFLSYSRGLDVFEYRTYDWRHALKTAPPIDPRLSIIEIDETSLAAFGQWPFPRAYHARLIEALSDFGARMIFFDMVFVEPGPDDAQVAAAAQKSGKVYFAEAFIPPRYEKGLFVSQTVVTPLLSSFRQAARGVGFVNFEPDRDGVGRRAYPVIHYENRAVVQGAVLMAAEDLGVRPDEIRYDGPSRLKLGDRRTLPLDDDGKSIVNFAGKWNETFKHYSYSDILKAHETWVSGGRRDEASDFGLKDSIAIVGLTATATHDIGPIPLDTLYPKVGIYANIFNMIMAAQFIIRLPAWANLIILWLVMASAVLLTRIPRYYASLAAALAVIALYVAGVTILFAQALVWVDLFYPVTVYLAVYGSGILKRAMEEKKKRLLIETELSIASQIQKSFLPSQCPTLSGMDMAVFMRPAKQVGGDLYNITLLGPGQCGIMVGDVSGKGMPAALFMARTVSEFKYNSRGVSDPEVTLRGLNDSIANEDTAGLFVTMNYAIFDMTKKKMILANAGHNPVLKMGADGGFEDISPSEGMPLGLVPGTDFGAIDASLHEGDIFVFYTDGISEARNSKREEYQNDRLKQVIGRFRRTDAADLLKEILKDLDRFVDDAPQHDDMTVAVIKIVSSV